jgi:hypothetical protein
VVALSVDSLKRHIQMHLGALVALDAESLLGALACAVLRDLYIKRKYFTEGHGWNYDFIFSWRRV